MGNKLCPLWSSMKLEPCMDQIETSSILLCFESTHCLCHLDVHPNPTLSSNDNTVVGGGELLHS
jgi:hypothetical protein